MNYDAKILNGLIATTIDSVDGYNAAAQNAENPAFRSIFTDRASEREDLVVELQTRVRDLGAEPEDDGTALAGAHRFFMDIRDTVTGTDDNSIIKEVERGEDHIKAKYEDAIADPELSGETRQIINRCFTSVKNGHDQMRDLKHGVTGAAAL
jgi:uncharacterized protein (TIGR02284 family)